MSEIRLSPSELRQAAEAFTLSSEDGQRALKRLDMATAKLEGRWSGAASMTFSTNYREWRQQMEAFIRILVTLSTQMKSIADRIEQTDR
jgi:WXG100 family type VII secretion target